MEQFINLLYSNDEWIIERTNYYARQHKYENFVTSSLKSKQMAVCGFNRSIEDTLQKYGEIPSLVADEDYSKDPIVAFASLETDRHRERGLEIDNFLRLLKLYRQSYIDLIIDSPVFNAEEKGYYNTLIQR